MARRREEPFNNPFADGAVAGALRQALPAAPAPSRPAVPTRARTVLTPEEERALWDAATAGGVPLRQDGTVAWREVVRARSGTRGPDDDALAALVRFVSGAGVFDLGDQDEFVEGPLPGADPLLLGRLRAGELSVQAWVDLHGLTVPDAREVLQRFVRRSTSRSLRCVLVEHGRGLHSKDRQPVLKERVVAWLSRGAMARVVHCFCTARPHDGGAGALYVLLRQGGERGRRRRHRRGRTGPASSQVSTR